MKTNTTKPVEPKQIEKQTIPKVNLSQIIPRYVTSEEFLTDFPEYARPNPDETNIYLENPDLYIRTASRRMNTITANRLNDLFFSPTCPISSKNLIKEAVMWDMTLLIEKGVDFTMGFAQDSAGFGQLSSSYSNDPNSKYYIMPSSEQPLQQLELLKKLTTLDGQNRHYDRYLSPSAQMFIKSIYSKVPWAINFKNTDGKVDIVVTYNEFGYPIITINLKN